MSTVLHNAIVVTSWGEDSIKCARLKAIALGLLATPIVESRVNAYWTFLVVPDGSKEGWAESDRGDEAREQFAEYLWAQRVEDGSSSLEWVEVAYGKDIRATFSVGAVVVRSEWTKPQPSPSGSKGEGRL